MFETDLRYCCLVSIINIRNSFINLMNFSRDGLGLLFVFIPLALTLYFGRLTKAYLSVC